MSTRSSQIEMLSRAIPDSRGDSTVEVELKLGAVSAIASVPAGKTKGGDEARTLPTPVALANVQQRILPFVREADADLGTHEGLIEVERRLIDGGGPNCADLGANAMLPVSIALCAWPPRFVGCPSTRTSENSSPLWPPVAASVSSRTC